MITLSPQLSSALLVNYGAVLSFILSGEWFNNNNLNSGAWLLNRTQMYPNNSKVLLQQENVLWLVLSTRRLAMETLLMHPRKLIGLPYLPLPHCFLCGAL